MSIFDDNITKELTIGNVFNVDIDGTDFPFQDNNSLCCQFFFKWVYYDCPDKATAKIIKRIEGLPISLIESYLRGEVRPIHRQFKKFLKHKYSHTNTFWVEGKAIINICIEDEILRWGAREPETLKFKIVLTRL